MPENAPRDPFLDEIARSLQPAAAGPDLQRILDKVMAHFACTVGTIHGLDPASGKLRLRAHAGIADQFLPRITAIPIGKGMAGLAAERREPVQVCNLQTDASGVARPSAKETGMEGSIAVPMLAADSLRGVLGIAKPVAYEFSQAEIALLQGVANSIGKAIE